MDGIAFSDWGLLLQERLCSYRSKVVPLRVDPITKIGKNESGEVVSSKSELQIRKSNVVC